MQGGLSCFTFFHRQMFAPNLKISQKKINKPLILQGSYQISLPVGLLHSNVTSLFGCSKCYNSVRTEHTGDNKQ